MADCFYNLTVESLHRVSHRKPITLRTIKWQYHILLDRDLVEISTFNETKYVELVSLDCQEYYSASLSHGNMIIGSFGIYAREIYVA